MGFFSSIVRDTCDFSASDTWTPASLGSALKGWWKADAGVRGRTAAQFTKANSESLSVNSNAALQTGDVDFWFAGWVYLDSLAATQDFAGKGAEYGFEFQVANTYFMIQGFGAYVGSGSALSTGAWHFLMGYHDSVANTIGISVDGAAFATAADTTITTTATAFNIGHFLGATYHDGRAANWAFGKNPVGGISALTTTIKNALYNAGAGVRYSDISAANHTTWGTISWWELDEESGTRADKIGGNTLTDNNTVTANDGKVDYALTTDGGAVWKWTDQSGVGNDWVQAIHTSKPLLKTNIQNGRAVIRFDGTNDYFTTTGIAIGASHTVAGAFITPTQGRGFLSGADNYIAYSTAGPIREYWDSAEFKSVAFSLPNSWNSQVVWKSGATLRWYEDAVQKGADATFAGSNSITLGTLGRLQHAAANYSADDIGELMISTTAEGAVNLTSINAYIKTRWGTP